MLIAELQRNTLNPTGYNHVFRSGDMYYGKYKGIHTGLRKTARIAAIVLCKRCRSIYLEIECVDILPVPYRHAFIPTPSYINEAEIEYLRDPFRKSGWRDVRAIHKLEPADEQEFVCATAEGKETFKTRPYKLPIEAAWAFHKRIGVIVKELYVVDRDFGPVDLSVIETLREPKNASGFKFVTPVGPYWCGSYRVNNITYYTRRYKDVNVAAWATYNHLCMAEAIRSTPETRAAAARKDMLWTDIRAKYHALYMQNRKDYAQSLGLYAKNTRFASSEIPLTDDNYTALPKDMNA